MTQVLSQKFLDDRGSVRSGADVEIGLIASIDLLHDPEEGEDGAVESDTAVEPVFLAGSAEHSFLKLRFLEPKTTIFLLLLIKFSVSRIVNGE